MFFGVSTLLFTDGETSILVDGFFTRPGLRKIIFEKIGPDEDLITTGLADGGVRNLAAVIVMHSHYDHVLDAPAVVKRFPNCVLIGSESTARIARGYHLSEDRICVDDGEKKPFGRFTVRLLPSPHSPIPWLLRLGIRRILLDGPVRQQVQPPACVSRFRNGCCYSLLIQHDDKSILVQASGGFQPGAFKDESADVVLLGVGTLGKMPSSYLDNYWHEVVETISAKRIFPIHWDDLTRPVDRPLVPIPLADNFDRTMRFLIKRAGETGRQIRLMRPFETIDPFADWEQLN